MSASITQREELYGLTGVYLDAYNAVVKPHQIFPVSHYMLRRWTPILGPTGFWIVISLQQACFMQGGIGRNWCVIDRAGLAAEAGTSETTAHRYLHGTGYVDCGLEHWAKIAKPKGTEKRRYSRRSGKHTQPPNRFTVLLDPPLAPTDQCGLAQYLIENGGMPGADIEPIMPALEQLASLQLNERLEMLGEHAARFKPPAGWYPNTFCATVADVVREIGITLTPECIKFCSQPHTAWKAVAWSATESRVTAEAVRGDVCQGKNVSSADGLEQHEAGNL